MGPHDTSCRFTFACSQLDVSRTKLLLNGEFYSRNRSQPPTDSHKRAEAKVNGIIIVRVKQMVTGLNFIKNILVRVEPYSFSVFYQ